jgi:hypothetical protein
MTIEKTKQPKTITILFDEKQYQASEVLVETIRGDQHSIHIQFDQESEIIPEHFIQDKISHRLLVSATKPHLFSGDLMGYRLFIQPKEVKLTYLFVGKEIK